MIVLDEHKVVEIREMIRFIDYTIGLFSPIPTKSAVKKAIKRHELYLNDELAVSGAWMQPGDKILLIDTQKFIPKPFPLEIKVLFEDDYLAIVNKPSGLIVSGNQYRTLVNCLVDQLILSSQPDAYKWGHPVHRLDFSTSGLVIVAKTIEVNRFLGDMLKQHNINKRYLAIVQGNVLSQSISSDVDGKSAKSNLKLLKQVKSLRNGSLSLVELTPESGRTHQLRIHCSSIGHPIVGDRLYGIDGEVMKHKGLFLVAFELEFAHPISKEIMCISLPIPNKFEALLRQEERRWNKLNDLKNRSKD